MVCLAEKIGDGTCRRGRGGVGRRVVAARRRKAANAPFALQSYPQGGNGVAAGTVKYLYYSNNWQVLETRWNGTAATDVAHQYVWSQMYIDAMVLRDTYSGGAIQPDARIYTQFDANYNVTALIGYNAGTNSWGVVQRYVYTPYGVATVLDANWNATTGQFAWRYMHQGGRQDPITGLYDFRHRDYSPTLGSWIEQDPLGYVNGGNRYGYTGQTPVGAVDPAGTKRYVFAFEGLGGFNGLQRARIRSGQLPVQGAGNWSEPFMLELLQRSGLLGLKNTVVEYYAQNQVGAAVAEAERVAKKNIGGCEKRFNTISVAGFSNGGDAAIQFAGHLRGDHIKIELGFTVDPVPKGLGFIWRLFPCWWNFQRPKNARDWVNYYQKFGGSLMIVGHRVTGANANYNVTAQVKALIPRRQRVGIWGGHLVITHVPWIASTLRNLVEGEPSSTWSNKYP